MLFEFVPAQSAAAISVYARPFVGLGALATVAMVFKPLLSGLLRAAWLTVKPRQSLEERISQRKFAGMLQLNRLAREYETSQPNLAAELRALAGRA